MAKRLFGKQYKPDVIDWEYEANFAKHASTYAFILSLAGVVSTAVGIDVLTQSDIVPGSVATAIGGLWTYGFVRAGLVERSDYKYYLGELAILNDKSDPAPQTNRANQVL